MIVLVDADSLIFASCYKNKEEKKIYPYYETLEECQLKFDQSFMSIVNYLERSLANKEIENQSTINKLYQTQKELKQLWSISPEEKLKAFENDSSG